MKTDEYSYENEVISLANDIELVKSMTEEEMQSYFNTDETKEEFISFLEEELRVAESFIENDDDDFSFVCLLYTSPSPRDRQKSRMPSSA